MRPSFAARRKPRKVGQGSDDENGGDVDMTDGPTKSDESSDPVITPSKTSRTFSKAKKNRSSLRTSFQSSTTSMNEDDEEPTAVFAPKKVNLIRQAQERSALRKNPSTSPSTHQLPLRQTEDRPSYDVEALKELKSSTPSTPKNLGSRLAADSSHGTELDLASKFGPDLAFRTDSAIPTDAEIREKKQRRARLATEQDYIGLDSGGDEAAEAEDSEESHDERSLLPYAMSKPSKKAETRLVRDDEDIAEGFEEFVEDGTIALSRKAQKEQKRQHEADMRAMIEAAEGNSNSDGLSEDESERERKAAYEATQTKAGMDGLKKDTQGARPRRPRTPPKITPLPTLAGCIEKLEAEVAQKQFSKVQKMRRLEEVKKELADIADRKVELQKLLDDAAEKYRRLRIEAGLPDGGPPERSLLENGHASSIEEMNPTSNFAGMSGMGLGLGGEDS